MIRIMCWVWEEGGNGGVWTDQLADEGPDEGDDVGHDGQRFGDEAQSCTCRLLYIWPFPFPFSLSPL